MTPADKNRAALPPLSPKDDFVFRKLFGDQNHVDMVLSFLKTFVDLPDDEYADIAVVSPNLVPEVKSGKSCVLDLRLRTRTGTTIHVEIQRCDTGEMNERIAVYGAKMLDGQIKSGGSYKHVNRVISVLITDFDLLDKMAGYHTRFQLRSDDGRIVLTPVLEFHILELRKVPVAEDGQRVWHWLKFLAAETKEEFTMLQQTYSDLQKPVARLMEMSEDEITRYQKDAWDKARWDEEARMRKSKAEGVTETKAEVAANMLKKGFPVSTIAELTGLALAEIEALNKA
ncbi:MAG: Rpn family recombination-promoting nuclease/putative transposase [Deltaproteobacteria bacterium]|nr:Rpn family recombination-promoting nuclease/putative transposase [Deltaproteobacteria bacterium]